MIDKAKSGAVIAALLAFGFWWATNGGGFDLPQPPQTGASPTTTNPVETTTNPVETTTTTTETATSPQTTDSFTQLVTRPQPTTPPLLANNPSWRAPINNRPVVDHWMLADNIHWVQQPDQHATHTNAVLWCPAGERPASDRQNGCHWTTQGAQTP